MRKKAGTTSEEFDSALVGKKNNSNTGATPQASSAASAHAQPLQKKIKNIGIRVPLEVSKQLQQIALDEDSSVQALLDESINMLFHSRGLPTIASKQAK